MEENLYTPNCIRTRSGKYVNVFDPKPEMFCIEDIAHALSHMPRFSGHLIDFYTVGQHSVECSKRVAPQFRYDALMHEASEAFLLDMAKPIKDGLPDYQRTEDNLMRVLAEVFGFTYPLPAEVKAVDKEMLELEWHQFMLGNNPIRPLPCYSPQKTRQVFMDVYNKLKKS